MEKVFEDIVYIMNHDYAGWEDKKGCDNPEYFLQKIRDEKQLSKEVFKEIVEDYLLDFNDQHIFFKIADSQAEKEKVRGFRVRRFEDRLYVTDVDSEKRLKPGMYFVSLGGHSIAELRGKHHRLLNENHPEREDWTSILSIYEKGDVENSEGIRSEISFAYYDKIPYSPTYSVQQLPENTVLITMTDFAKPDAIMKMITENQAVLDSAEKWVIDVRINYGGSDSSYFPLLPYLMTIEGVELSDKDEKQYFNCTVANEKRIQSELVDQLESTTDEEAKRFLGVFQREWKRNKGKGFVEFDFSDIMPDTFIKGKELPKSVVVLADVKCGSSGDSFVEYCKKSRKVTVIGRATMGLNDYANLTSKIWDEGFEFAYPTSRLSRIDKGQGMTGVGIEPHLHIPWTPEHLEVDVDMDQALKILSLTNSPLRN
ncbi:S41 family peptidase [Sporosarcina siberiensis]|uniref:S41 family peptidase n=1 Tax=Sporosarcina siberiensis TaxID=1365606 RepID=A0ABW4SFE2_9BACL